MSQPELKKTLTLWLLTFYGLGTILGAGIYVLIAEISVKAGLFAPLSFLVAAVIATFTALSYAELSSRLPYSAGEALYIDRAFHRAWLSQAVGWSVIATGVVSSATLAGGFVGYFQQFLPSPGWLVVVVLVLLLGALAAWGISQSVWLATAITVLEVGGLIYVVVLGGDSLLKLPELYRDVTFTWNDTAGIFLGGFVAFYAFIGFEDMVNVAEEARNPRVDLPRSIVLALIISTVLYLLVALVAISAVPLEQLQQSKAPLATVLMQKGYDAKVIISLISLVAVVNGALIQIIMASRVLYGMARQGMGLAVFGKVEARTQTPVLATGVVTLLILVFALWLPVAVLAQLATLIILMIFVLVNASLWRLKKQGGRHGGEPAGFNLPIWVPVSGAFLCAFFIMFRLISLVT